MNVIQEVTMDFQGQTVRFLIIERDDNVLSSLEFKLRKTWVCGEKSVFRIPEATLTL